MTRGATVDFRNATEQDLWTAAGQEEGAARAEILYQLSARLYERGAHGEAAAASETAAGLFAAANRPYDEASSRYGLGLACRELDRWDDAVDAFRAASSLFRVAGREDDLAMAEARLADALRATGRWEEALDHWRTAANLYQSAGELDAAGGALMSRGECLGSSGEYTLALDQFERARTLFRRAGDAASVAFADDRAAAALIELGRLDEAIDRLRAALHVAEAGTNARAIAYARYRLGWTLSIAGRNKGALTQLKAARRDYLEVEDTLGAARCDMQAANALSNLGKAKDAIALYRRVRSVFDAHGRDHDMMLAEANLAITYANTGRSEQAAVVNRVLLDRATQLKDTYIQFAVASRLARDLIDLGRAEDALQVLDDCAGHAEVGAELSETAGLRATRSRVLLELGKVTDAAEQAQALIDDLRDSPLREQLAQAHAVLSDVELRTGDRSNGEWHRARAVALFLAIGNDVEARRLSEIFLEDGSASYDARHH